MECRWFCGQKNFIKTRVFLEIHALSIVVQATPIARRNLIDSRFLPGQEAKTKGEIFNNFLKLQKMEISLDLSKRTFQTLATFKLLQRSKLWQTYY